MNIIIDHNCSFTAYIIAYALYFQFSNHLRSLRIIIVENEFSHLFDTKPWCGISSFNISKLTHSHQFINWLFSKYTIPLSRISIQAVSQTPDQPRHEIMTTMIDHGRKSNVARFYHPVMLMNEIRYEMFRSGKVSFVSTYHKQQLINDLTGVVISCPSGKNQTRNDSFMYNSNLMEVKCVNDPNAVPRYVLWLPKFTRGKKSQGIQIDKFNNFLLESNACDPLVNVDLNYALSQCDIIIKYISLHIPHGNKL
ncbi:hypothetical protein SBY92_002937 [Candida maltosa Xu316]